MNIILEGMDRVGKSTLARMLQTWMLANRATSFHNVSCCAFKLPKGKEEEVSRFYYSNLIAMMCQQWKFIFDRSHIGEAVYSPIYRGYNGDYVFNIEKYYGLENHNNVLFLFDASNQILISRDDGYSFTSDAELEVRYDMINNERKLFNEAYEKTSIKYKKKIDITGKTIEQVFEEMIDYLKEIKLC